MLGFGLMLLAGAALIHVYVWYLRKKFGAYAYMLQHHQALSAIREALLIIGIVVLFSTLVLFK